MVKLASAWPAMRDDLILSISLQYKSVEELYIQFNEVVVNDILSPLNKQNLLVSITLNILCFTVSSNFFKKKVFKFFYITI